ncbi:MAG: DUF4249 domain-containing protein [Bacteroidales bacterium]|nr:DUF4249 domain-containing protein [Bacteroidales bacterium]
MPIIISVCLLSACTEVIDIDLEQTKPYIVVNSIIDADTTVKVSLSYSRFFLEGGDFRKINDANVVVKRNGSPMTLSSVDQGDYIFAETVHAGDILDLCVVVPGYDTVTASTQVPSTPDVSAKGGLRFVEQRDEYGGLSVTGRLTLRLYDKPGVQYYYVQIFSHINSSDNGSSKYFICNNPLVNNIASSDILSQLESELDGETNELYFSDELFDGKDIDISFDIPLYYSDYSSSDTSQFFSVHVTELTPALFRYLRSSQADDEDLFSMFTEPVQVICNIRNGIGIFAAQSRTRLTYQKED